jgi:cellulose biosynthesis protein BcsQ
MKITIFNQKGGVGKTMLATQIALYFDLKIVELDPYGILNQLLPDRVIKLGLRDHINENLDNVVYDFGGFDDLRLGQVAKQSDLVIIPFNPTLVSLGGTLKSYLNVKNYNDNILFVANGYLKEQDVKDAIEFLEENIKEPIDYFAIPYTRAVQTAKNEIVSIIELPKAGGLKRHTYSKIARIFKELMEIIKNKMRE